MPTPWLSRISSANPAVQRHPSVYACVYMHVFSVKSVCGQTNAYLMSTHFRVLLVSGMQRSLRITLSLLSGGDGLAKLAFRVVLCCLGVCDLLDQSKPVLFQVLCTFGLSMVQGWINHTVCTCVYVCVRSLHTTRSKTPVTANTDYSKHRLQQTLTIAEN